VVDERKLNPERWVEEHGDVLFGYALARVRDRQVAEDIVQETLVSAFRARESFSGKSSERTWLVGILKHKIHDYYRKHYRERETLEKTPNPDDERFIEGQFDRWSHWKHKPAAWRSPESALEEKEFWKVLRQCIDALPTRLGDAFSLRVLDGLETDSICKILDITTTNLGVMLHRARISLRRCLEENWFEGGKGKDKR
jgi:RNA polymerase sigma-70 factor (ECF subfamily)